MYRTAEEYMNSISDIRTSIRNKRSELKELRDAISLTSAQYDVEKIRKSNKRDKLEQSILDNVEKREALERRIEDEITEMLLRQDTAVSLINMIDSDDQKDVLMLRYIEGRTWWDIMELRGRDDLRSQYRLHQRALDALQSIIDSHLRATQHGDNM